MQISERYKLKIPEARDGLFKTIELYKELFHAIDALIFYNRFIGVEFTHEMRSKLNNIQYTNLAALEIAIINLQESYQVLTKMLDSLGHESEYTNNLLNEAALIIDSHAEAIKSINEILASAEAADTLDAITGLIDMLNGNSGDIMAALRAKAEASEVAALKERIGQLEYQVQHFDRFGVITDESDNSEYYITALNGAITLKETDKTLVNKAVLALDIPGADDISSNILLPIDIMECGISWVSNSPVVVQDNGIVTRPEYGKDPVDVVLTAKISKGPFSASKEIEVRVTPITAYEQLVTDMNSLALPLSPITGDISLPTSIGAVSLTWASSDESYLLPTGKLVKRPASHELDKSIVLIAIGSLEEEIRTKPFPLVILRQ